MIREFFKRRALLRIISKMSPALIKGYGSRDYYSAGQVYQTALSLGLSKRHLKYNLALFCCEIEPSLANKLMISEALFTHLRDEIKHKFFLESDYSAIDIMKLVHAPNWKGGRMDDYMSHHRGMNSRF